MKMMPDLCKLLLHLLGFRQRRKRFTDYMARIFTLISNVFSIVFCLFYVFNSTNTFFSTLRAVSYVYTGLHVLVIYVFLTQNAVLSDHVDEWSSASTLQTNAHVFVEILMSIFTLWQVFNNILAPRINSALLLPIPYVLSGEISFSAIVRLQTVACNLVIASYLTQLSKLILYRLQLPTRKKYIKPYFGSTSLVFLDAHIQTDQPVNFYNLLKFCDDKLHDVLTTLIVLLHVEYFVALVADVAVWVPEDLLCGYIRMYAVFYNASHLHTFLLVVAAGEAVDKNLRLARREARRFLLHDERIDLRIFLQSRYSYISLPTWRGCCAFVAIGWSFALLVIQSAIATRPQCRKAY